MEMFLPSKMAVMTEQKTVVTSQHVSMEVPIVLFIT